MIMIFFFFLNFEDQLRVTSNLSICSRMNLLKVNITCVALLSFLRLSERFCKVFSFLLNLFYYVESFCQVLFIEASHM